LGTDKRKLPAGREAPFTYRARIRLRLTLVEYFVQVDYELARIE
jgi:hypothetical protein